MTGTFSAGGGPGAFRVRTAEGCPWSARSSASWVTVTEPASGTGEREIRYSVGENFTTSGRSAMITVVTATHQVVQARAEEIELKGKISGLSGTCPNLRFTVQTQLIRTDKDTSFRDGKCSDARNGSDVVVTGLRTSDGSVDARRVEFDR